MPTDQSWPEDVVAAWVQASCRDQGVEVKIVDPLAMRQVQTLLQGGAVNGGGAGRGALQASASAPRAARPLSRPLQSHAPDRSDAGGVEAARARGPGFNDRVVEDGGDDRRLPGQVEAVPRIA